MRDREKKHEEDEMLVTHKPEPEPQMGDRAVAVEPPAPAADAAEMAALERRLATAADPAERREIASLIQTRFGNAAADRAIRAARATRPPAEPAPPDPAAGGSERRDPEGPNEP